MYCVGLVQVKESHCPHSHYILNVQEPSLFAMASMQESGLANLHRVEMIWGPITSHLVQVDMVEPP